MSAPKFPEAMSPVELIKILQPLSLWASKPSAEVDLESIFGPRLDWATAFKHLVSFRGADYSLLPAIHTLPAADMPGLWGGYSRDTREIYLSADCPQALLSAVLIEEIGHFLDQEICFEETPGEEGARFAALVLDLPVGSDVDDDSLALISFEGRELLVEAARKARGSGKSKAKQRGISKGGAPNNGSGYAQVGSSSSNPKLPENIIYATQDSARIVQKASGDRLIGSRGDDTFVVLSQDVTIEDPNGGTDTVESSVTFSLANHSIIEKLALAGASNINGTGNAVANLITGNAGNNVLDGGGGADNLQGGAGNDTLLGGDGSDLLDGGEGEDLLDGGLGIDSMSGGAGNDTYYVGSASELVIEAVGGGTDTIITSDRSITLLTYANIENIIYTGAPGGGGGGSESVSTLGTDNDDYLFGGSGNDTIIGKAGNDTLEGKAGNDSLDGGAGSDVMSGGIGNDTYFVDAATDIIQENSNEGTDLVISSVSLTLGANVENLTLNASLAVADANINGTGNAIANLITGNAGNNQLDGGGGVDTLTAGAGNDILNGGTADGVGDSLNGGAGNDRYIVDSTLDVIRDSGGTDTVQTTVSFNIGDTLSVEGIEHLLYKGSAAATLTGSAGDNSLKSEGTNADALIGGAGNDTLDGGGGANSLFGGNGDDYYIVSSSSEKIYEDNSSGSGLDTVLTKAATLALGLDSNVEILTYDSLGTAKTNLSGSNSDNTITGGNFGNSLSGLGGNDYLIGGVQGDTLLGVEGDDTLDGKGGTNSLIGGAGNDYYFTDSQSVNILEVEDTLAGGDKDTVRSSVAFNLSYSRKLDGIEGLYLTGSASLAGTGNSGDNTITGNDGNNVLEGKAGNDTILGGLGADYINGDEGNDSIVGGGDIQGDVPANASTPILLASGQTYTGQINSRNETDWIKVDLQVGVTYTFTIDSQLDGAGVLKDRSDVAFGSQGSDQYWPTWQDGNFGYQPPLVGDLTTTSSRLNGQPWIGDLTDHDELVLNANGTVAYGYFDPKQITKSTRYENNIVGFQFTPFESGTFYVPVSGAGPALGSYRLTLTDPDNLASGTPALADNASNTLLGGAGADTVVAGNGRDAQGKAIGDILLGGTNGLLGQVDIDLSGDTLIGGDGNDSLDGGNGANSLVGGKGDDYYYIRSQSDIVVEQTDGGTGDAMIVNFAAKLAGEWDIVLDPDYVEPNAKPVFQFANIENVTLTGSAHTSVLGSPNSDKIVGNFGNNTFAGGVGDDTLQGEGGNDSLVGGEGADSLDGGSGINTMDGGLGSDTYIVNDRNDRIINEIAGLDGGLDLIRTYFNFDPIQGSALEQFQVNQPDDSPSRNKAPSFASKDITSFYNLENFELLGGAVYGVGNALQNSLTASASSALLLGMGSDDTLLGGAGGDTLHGDTPDFYASPDLYAPTPTDTRTQAFLSGVIGDFGNDYLDGGAGDNYLDGGRGFDTMIGGEGNDTFVQDNVDDYIVAGGGANELISSVNIAQAPDGISKLMLVVANQTAESGQNEVASFASFARTKNGNNRTVGIELGGLSLSLTNANTLELMYAPREGEVFVDENLIKGPQEDDLANPGKFQYDLSWTAGVNAATDVAGYVVKYKRLTTDGSTPFVDGDGNADIWHTYVNGKSQDFQGTQANPFLTVTNLEEGTYDFQVIAIERTIPALQDRSAAQHVTLQGGAGNDAVIGLKLGTLLPGGLEFDFYTDPLVQNNPNSGLPLGFIFNPAPYNNNVDLSDGFASYLDGGFGNDILNGDSVNDRSGDDYVFQGVSFKGLNTLVGGQGSDTFVVKNGGNAIGDEFDWVVKYGNETPVSTETGVGASLNGGQHNLVVSRVPYLVLSDTFVHQGKFIDQLALADFGQFGMGNRLDNYIYDGFWTPYASNTLVGNTGRDSIIANSSLDVLIGGTAYGTDNVGLAIADFVGVNIGGNGLTNSIFRDTDPVPVSLSGPAVADPSQFWFVPGYYGGVYDPNRNQDTLAASDKGKFETGLTLDGGAGRDSLAGTDTEIEKIGDMFIVSQGQGGKNSQDTLYGDAVIGNGGNDTVTFTDSDYLWWSGHQEGALLLKNTYTLGSDISNLILGSGAASARNGTGNKSSTGYEDSQGSNLIIGNEFANILDGDGVGGKEQTGSGIDTLTGGSGDDLFVVSGYTKSTGNKWDVSAEKINKKDDPNDGKFELDLTKSTFTDADYVLINDFEAGDSIRLSSFLQDYWIGAAPSKPGLAEDNVTPGAAGLTEFGLYKAPTGLKDGPNLVAHIRLKGWSLAPADLSPSNYPLGFTPNFGPISASKDRLGWGEFYSLAGSSFAPNVDQGQYVQKDSYASLVQIFLAGDNTFQGGSSNDTFNGYDGNDTLKGGAGNDTLIGGEGQDSLLGEAGADSLLGDAGSDTILGGDGNDTLDGGVGRDSLLGEAGDDSLFGGSGNDFLDGGAGVNSLMGGDGNDTLVWIAQNATMDGGAGINDLLFNSGATLDDTSFGVISNISRIALSNDADLVTLGINAVTKGFTSINSNGGNDTLDASAINAVVTLSGGAGADSILGGSASDSLVGGADNDTLLGGGNGDTLLGEAGADSLLGGAGTDSLLGGADNDTLLGEDGNDTLLGEAGADSLLGGAGTDSLLGGADNDTLLGEEGNDTLLGEAGADSLLGGAGTDSLLGGADNDTLLGEEGNDTLLGEAGADSLLGGAGADSLVAGTGTDTLLGDVGNDTLVADATGVASLLGGDDNDSFLFTSGTQLANNTVVGGLGTDTLVLTAAATVIDAQLAKVSGVEVIQASSLVGNSITLGTNAQAGAVLSLFGGASSDILSAAGMSSGNIWIQGYAGSGSSSLGDTLVAGTGTSRATLVGNDSLTATTNYFQTSTAALLGNNSIVGGASSTDYLQITTNGQVLSDSSFAQVSGLDGLILTGGANTITLGATAQAKFGGTVSLTGGANGGDTINLSATTKKVYLDASAGINGDTITAGTNDNTLIGGSAASANDLFIFTSESNLNGASVVGGGGTDTLRFAANFQTVANTDLDKLSSIEVFDLAGAGNSITLGNISSGIATIVGGTGPNTIDASGYISAPNVLTWDISRSAGRDSLVGGESGNLFQVKIPGYLEISQIAGTVGNDDTIQILTGSQVIGETAFANISSIEKLVLGTATKGNKLTLGATAAAKGIATVVGGGSKDTIDASAFTADIRIDASAGTGAQLIGSSSNNNTLIGGSAGGNEFVLGSLGTNVVVGGSNGLDTLTFTNTTTAADFSNLSKVAVLKFNSANNDIALGSDALIAGILTLVGGQGSDTGSSFDASAYGSVGLMFNITDQNYLKNSTLIGSAGMDTVKFSRDGVSVTDEVVANLYNIDVLQTANGNNTFLISDQFVAAGIDSIIGGLGKDTFDMSDNGIYTPSSVSDVPGASSDVIAFDASAGAGYTLIASTQSLSYAKVFGGASGGEVIVDGNSLDDSAFANMFAANANKLTMRTASGVAVTLGGNAQFSGLTTLNLGGGDDQLDVTDFGGPLAVAGGGGADLVKTSFSAFSDLTFNGSANSTLQVVDSDARAITSLKGSFGALALNAGNNFVSLGNDAGLSTIYGGSGYDTFSMLSNTTGVHFVIDPNKLGSVSGFNSLNGGSGSDTLSFSTNPTGNTFSDSQFLRIGSKNLNAGSGGEIENLVTYADPITGKGGATYTLGQFSDNAGINTVFFHQDDSVDAEDRAAVSSKSVNFIFTDPNALGTSQITGSDHAGSNDTLTAKVVNAGNFTIRDVDFLNIRLVENFYFDTTNANGALDFEYGPNAYKSSNGIEKLVGNIGADTLRLDCLMVATTPFVFEGGDGTDTVVLINGLFSSAPVPDPEVDPAKAIIEIKDGKFAGWKSVEQLFIDWTSPDYNRDTGIFDTAYNLTLDKNASDAGITKITGNKGDDTLNASAYLIAATIIGGEGDDSILSGTGVDSLDGGKGNDSLFSGAGNDSLIGGEGNDWLQGTSATSGGASEIDTLTGGLGNDTFVLGDSIRAYYDTPALASDYALIMDFTAGDKLQLKNFGADGYIIQPIVAGSSYSLYRDSNGIAGLQSGADNLIASITTTNNRVLTSADFNLVG